MNKTYLSENIFLNKNLIRGTNFHKNCLKVRSPWSENMIIWFPLVMTHDNSTNKRYFSVTIKKNNFYQIYSYLPKSFEVNKITEIRGETLIEAYKKMKDENSKLFLKKQDYLKVKKTDIPDWLQNGQQLLDSDFDDEENIVWDE